MSYFKSKKSRLNNWAQFLIYHGFGYVVWVVLLVAGFVYFMIMGFVDAFCNLLENLRMLSVEKHNYLVELSNQPGHEDRRPRHG